MSSVLPALTSHSARPSSASALADRARRGHPVERLVGAAVGVDQHGAVRLEHQHAGGQRQVGRQPSGVVHLAARDDDPHDGRIYSGPVTDHDVRPARQRDLAHLGLDEPPGPGSSWSPAIRPSGHARVDLSTATPTSTSSRRRRPRRGAARRSWRRRASGSPPAARPADGPALRRAGARGVRRPASPRSPRGAAAAARSSRCASSPAGCWCAGSCARTGRPRS